MAQPPQPPHDDDPTSIDRIVELVILAARASWRAGSWSVATLGTGLEASVRQAMASRVHRAVEDPGPADTDLAAALHAARASSSASQVASAAVPRLARRFAPARAATRRSPIGLAVWVGPALQRAVRTSLAEVSALAAGLTDRARQEGVQPDAARVQVAAVRIASGRFDAHDEVVHRHLALRWLQRIGGSLLPVGLGAGPSLDAVLAEVDAVDVDTLGAQ